MDSYAGCCAYCGDPADTWDHITPVVQGGVTDLWNIVPACRSCNSRKRDCDVFEWMREAGVSDDRVLNIAERLVMEHLSLSHYAA